MTLIFPVDDEMTTIVCGAEPGNDNWPYDFASRGIKQRLGDVYFPTLSYTNTYDAELAVQVMSEKKKPVIGLVEPVFLPVVYYKHLKKQMPYATFVNATDWLDEIKAIKSEEEIGLIREAAALGDATLEHYAEFIQPGMRGTDVYAEIHRFLAKNGSDRALIGIGSGPQGAPVPFIDDPHYSNRVIQDGDVVSILMEFTGPGGYYVESHRPVVLGKPIPELEEAFAAAVECQEEIASQMVDGADAAELWNIFKTKITGMGYAPPVRSFAHAQGLSFLERPNLRPDETWKLNTGRNIAVHPGAAMPKALAMVFDNYLVGEDGAECLQKFPKKIITL